jgi:hypothetical protein
MHTAAAPSPQFKLTKQSYKRLIEKLAIGDRSPRLRELSLLPPLARLRQCLGRPSEWQAVKAALLMQETFGAGEESGEASSELVRAAHSPFDCKDAPISGDTFERMIAAVTKTQARTRHQVLYRARYQHLARAGERRHARSDVNGNAADIIRRRGGGRPLGTRDSGSLECAWRETGRPRR